MENNRNFPARQFHSLTFFAGLCIGITPVAQVLAAEGQTNADDTLVVEASTPSLYAPQQSADPKFSRPVADTTRTMTVISEQVIKDQGATNLTDALKNVPGVGAFFAGENGNSTTGDAIYMRGADTSNSIYIDGIRDIGSVSRDTFNTEQVEVIKGPSGTDYGRSAPTGSINMISKQPRNDSGIDASASIGSAWFRRGTLDVNQVIGDTTAVRLNVMGEKRTMPHATKSKMSVTASPLLSLLALVQRIVCILIICMSPSTTRQTVAFRLSVYWVILPHLRERRP